jgi:WD40 repeat protein
VNRTTWGLISLVALGFTLSFCGPLQGADPPAPDARPDGGTDKPALKDRLGDPLPAGALVRFGTHRLRQSDTTEEVAFHPDGKLIAAIDGRGRVGLWDAVTGKPVVRRPAIDARGHTFAFSPDGKWLATHEERGVGMWDLRGKNSFLMPRGDGLTANTLAFSPCGRYLAEGGRLGAVFLYHVGARKAIFRLKGHRLGVTTVAFSPDGKLLASGEGDGKRPGDTPILLWETESGRLLARLEGHTDHIHAVAFSPDGKTLVSSSLDRSLRFWDVATRRQTRKIAHRAVSLAFSPDGKLLASGTEVNRGGITLWDPGSGERLRTFAPGVSVEDLAFSPDGKRLLCTNHHAVSLWEVTTGKEVLPFKGHRGAVLSLAFSPDGKTLATWGGDYTTRLWDVASARQLHCFSVRRLPRRSSPPVGADGISRGSYEGKARSVAFSPDGKTVACLGIVPPVDWALWVWDVDEGQLREPIPCGDSYLLSLAFTPDSKSVAVADPRQGTRLIDLATGKPTPLPEVEPGIDHKRYHDLSLDLSPDGRTLAVAYSSSKIRFWDLSDRTPLRDLGPTSKVKMLYGKFLAFSPDGAVLAACSCALGSGAAGPPQVQLWEVASGKLIAQMVPRVRYGVNCVAFSPDGRLLATAHDGENTAQLWDLATGKLLATLRGHQGEVVCLAFSPDGNTLATGSTDTTALLWDVRKFCPKPLPRPDRDDLPKLWDRLRDDPARAYPALWQLAAAGDDAVALLRKHLRPVPTPDPKRLRSLLKDLDSDRFKVRDEARRGLVAMGEPAGPALRRLLEGKPSLEVRRLAEQVLEQIRAVADHGTSLREQRALTLLEWIGSEAAQEVLRGLSRGDPKAPLTRQAGEALQRIERRQATRPGRDSCCGSWPPRPVRGP